ncbi:hypothetical protein N8I74_03315 [Chitiniphilus purpureus]|uniref:Uncharacterized protein n=1 Tax=Chitiniphilus purpureus TaxID=2981137 RepID=A0ABY6DNX9_9NEIS|nr:hypothetical protein [Chitiniphilus sp. CD1]UXY16066.1 hypothetical protein N8I74_03315 [Chitiniphilus sp. CD1]
MVDITGLAAKDQRIIIKLDYLDASGAGSGTFVTHTLRISNQGLTIDTIELRAASRDGTHHTHVDYTSGEVTDAFDAPGLPEPQAPILHHFKPHPIQYSSDIVVALRNALAWPSDASL